jgi:hypothetical protein
MCQKVLEKLPSMTAEERSQLRHNCLRATQRSRDALVIQEAKRLLAELDALERRELGFLAKLPAERRIEYAFRRLPATERERWAIRLLHDHQGKYSRLTAVWTESEASPWHRYIADMCRSRRHLLAVADATPKPDAAADEPTDWAHRLIDIDDDGRSVRLKPEAAAAFTRLGYVSRRDPERYSAGAGDD